MFESILQHLSRQSRLSPDTTNWVQQVCHHWDSISEEKLWTMQAIVQKYSFENLPEVRREDSQETRLEFWTDTSQFNLNPALEDHDLDEEFIGFVHDFQDTLNFTTERDLSDEESDQAWDEFYTITERLFQTWAAFLWQEADGMKGGVPACWIENSSIRMFYFNDMISDDFSAYHNRWHDERIDGSVFQRKLHPLEIFTRTGGIRGKNVSPFWLFRKGDLHIRLKRQGNVTTLEGNTKPMVITHEPDRDYDNSQDVAARYFVEKSNELMNENWILEEG